MKAISFSLFGYGRQVQNSFEFNTYLRGLMVNVRVSRVLYPGWDVAVIMDERTYRSPYERLFDVLEEDLGLVNIAVVPNNYSLCEAMLWRLKPVFEKTGGGTWLCDHVLCRDIDSVGTYREAQAVQQWIAEDKTVHCITDSISHNIPMMGGMIGVRPAYLAERLRVQDWNSLMAKNPGIDFNRKGSDQDFLNRIIYPKCADSATEHFILGMKQTIPEGDGRHYSIADVEVQGVDPVHRQLNDCAGHIGAAGFYEPPMLKWLNTIDPYRDEYAEIEKEYPNIFFWRG